jgi:hypothetical protein
MIEDKMEKLAEQMSKAKVTVIDKQYDWGIYIWVKENGRAFTDGEGNVLNIPSTKGDESQIKKLRDVASHYGEPNGKPVFFPGLGRATEEEYEEQKERMAQGLIPNMNDLGAVHAAQQTLLMYGDEG